MTVYNSFENLQTGHYRNGSQTEHYKRNAVNWRTKYLLLGRNNFSRGPKGSFHMMTCTCIASDK